VPLRLSVRHLPTRLATGAYVLHAGMEKWHANPDQAARMHAMATGAFGAGQAGTPAGIGISKDVWMLAIGLSLLADRAADNATTS
jgi:hypothetical protein